MNYDDISLNKMLLSGIINGVVDTNDKYIKFGILQENILLWKIRMYMLV